MRSDPETNADDILLSIGRLTEFIWNVMVDMQREAGGSPLAPDLIRHQSYAKHLSARLGMNEKVAFEDVTIVVSVIHPYYTNLDEHKDVMNDNIAGYTRTGCLNMCFRFKDGEEDYVIHFQVITNFRKVINRCVRNGWLPKDPFANFKMTLREVERNRTANPHRPTISYRPAPCSTRYFPVQLLYRSGVC